MKCEICNKPATKHILFHYISQKVINIFENLADKQKHELFICDNHKGIINEIIKFGEGNIDGFFLKKLSGGNFFYVDATFS